MDHMAAYKLNLLSNDDELQFETIINIRLELLSTKDPAARREYSKTLIDMEIARILCLFVGVSDIEMSRSTLLIFQMLSECPEFYTKNIARRAITHILQKGRQFLKNEEDDHLTMPPICNTLTALLTRAIQYRISLNTICNTDVLLEFMNELYLDEVNHYLYILAVTNLYAGVASMLKTIHRENKLNVIIEIHQKVLEAANEVTKELVKYADMRYADVIRPITIICNAGMRFYESSCKSRNFMKAVVHWDDLNSRCNILSPIFHITRNTILNNVIPHSQCIDVTTVLNSVSSYNFTNCLCQIYKCDDIDQTEFSHAITEHGYLKYLHGMLDPSKPYCEMLCGAIAQIAVDVSHKYLAMDKWSSGLQGFLGFMKKGLIELMHPTSSNDDAAPHDVLLFLIYIHFHATEVFNIIDYVNAITKLNMSKRVMAISVDNIPDIPMLQVISFLFAASVLSKPSGDIDELYHAALPRMIQILAKVGVENCYTENRTIPILVLESSAFPNEIPNKIVKLWLKFRGNVYLLLTPGPHKALIECLLNIVNSDSGGYVVRCSWKLLRTLEYSVNPTSSLGGQIIQSMWANMPELLTAYSKEHESRTELYLKMVNHTIMSNVLEMSTIIDCAKAIIEIMLRIDIALSNKLRTSLTHQAARLIHGAITAIDDRVIWFFVNNYPILEKLRKQAYEEEDCDLSAASFGCLAVILRSQARFKIQCSRPVILSHKNLMKPLLPYKSTHYDVLDFYDRILIDGIEKPAIVIAPMTQIETKQILVEIYRMYCVIHLNGHESQWECTFHCMANILRYLSTDYRSALVTCCGCYCNYPITSRAIEAKFYSIRFFDFVRVWIRMSMRCRILCVRDALASRKDREKKRGRVFFESPFLKVLYQLEKHIEEAIELGQLKREKVTELIDYLKELI